MRVPPKYNTESQGKPDKILKRAERLKDKGAEAIHLGNCLAGPCPFKDLYRESLEKEIENVRGMKEITSISAPDASMIFVEFNTDVDLEDALRRVKDAVDRVEDLPTGDDVDGPTVFDIDFFMCDVPVTADDELTAFAAQALQVPHEALHEIKLYILAFFTGGAGMHVE